MRGALVDAGLTPNDVDLVNAHATSTKIGDAAEAYAIKRFFGNEAISHNLTALRLAKIEPISNIN